MNTPPRHAAHGAQPIVPPEAPPVEQRRFLPPGWTHSDTMALELAHELISNYTGLFSAEFGRLIQKPEQNAARIEAILANDLAAAADRDKMASFDMRAIVAITNKYDRLLTAARSIQQAAS